MDVLTKQSEGQLQRIHERNDGTRQPELNISARYCGSVICFDVRSRRTNDSCEGAWCRSCNWSFKVALSFFSCYTSLLSSETIPIRDFAISWYKCHLSALLPAACCKNYYLLVGDAVYSISEDVSFWSFLLRTCLLMVSFRKFRTTNTFMCRP